MMESINNLHHEFFKELLSRRESARRLKECGMNSIKYVIFARTILIRNAISKPV